jgi:ADP-heptose:LPS heptosyltransferase
MTISRNGVAEPFLAGVVAIRGRIVSRRHLSTITIYLDELEVGRVALTPAPRKSGYGTLHVFNIWIDVGRYSPGRYRLRVKAAFGVRPFSGLVTVGRVDESDVYLRESPSYVPSLAGGYADVARTVLARAAIARTNDTASLTGPVRSLLVVRADQLGDVATSLPAMKRLRQLYPGAHVTALVQPACVAAVERSGVVDHVETILLQNDAESGGRYLPVEEEARLRALFSATRFDVAIDLCPGRETRPLLLLSQARVMVGFDPERFPYLDFGIHARSRDKVNRLDRVPHGAMVMMLVEALALTGGSDRLPALPVRAAPGPRPYVVIHTGASRALNRWPRTRFLALAGLIRARHDVDLIVFDDAPDGWPGERTTVLGQIDATAFDEIIAGAALVIGNDSGPKHLAAARGVPTISLHVDRLNWNEWGQIGAGIVLSKRVPCAGCTLSDIDLCGRAADCLTAITEQEVADAVATYVPDADRHGRDRCRA